MTWGIVAGAAISAGTAAVGASASNKANAANASANANAQLNSAAESYRSTELKYKQLSQDYAANTEQNMNNLIRQSYRSGLMNVQLAMQKRQAIAQGFDTSQKAAAFMGTASANAAAAGAAGASADAVMNDIKMKAAQAQLSIQDQYSQQLENFNSEVEAVRLNNLMEINSPREILLASTGSLSDPININTKYAYTNPLVAGAGAGLGSFAGNYIASKTSLNLGGTPSTPGGASASTVAAFGPSTSTLGSGTFGMGSNQSSSSPINGGWSIY